jgi:hypothetical protein
VARVEVSGAGRARRWTLHLPPLEARLVAGLPAQVERLLTHPEENRRVVDRLFPPSYADAAEELEHRKLLGESLLESRRELLESVRRQLAAAPRDMAGLRLVLDEAGVDGWMRFVNDVRLVLATDLGVDRSLSEVTIEPGHPDAPRFSLLVYLGGLEHVLLTTVIGDPGF